MSVWGLLYMLHCTSFQLGKTDSKRPIDDKFAGNACVRRRGLHNGVMTSRISHGRYWQIVLKKSFLADERNFRRPLMRFVLGDVRDLIVLHKNDHGPSDRPYSALQR
jgi:hypothetical protein